MDKVVNILVVRASAMGDVAMTVPVLGALVARYGSSVNIVMLTREFYAPFFDGIDNVTVYDIDLYDRHSGVKGIYRLYKELTSKFEFDMVIDLNYKLYSRLLRRFFIWHGVKTYKLDKGRAEKKALTRVQNKEFVQLRTSVERYADVFREAGFAIEVPNVLPARKFSVPKDKGEMWIGIAPFAKHIGKMLPIETIRHLISDIVAINPSVKIFIFGGGRSEAMVAESLCAWYVNCESVIGKYNLKGEMQIMGQMDVMISMDSSAMHICSLVGTPVISIWGATHPFAGFLGLGQLMEDVVGVDIACRPCSVYGHKPCFRGDYACLRSITSEQIINHIRKRGHGQSGRFALEL